MNREFKRRMKRDQRAQERAVARGQQRPPIPVQQAKRERTGIRQYFREIQAELKRVMWPTRNEVFTYSIVVVFVVSLLTGVVFVLDLGFAQAILDLFKPAAGR
ncbi:MAG: preprotein translocase subunit SecE [Actinomycetota bacterium]